MDVRNCRRSTAVGLAALTVSLAGCGTDDGDGREDPATIVEPVQVQLEGRSFVADRVTGRDLVTGTSLELSFDDGRLAVTAGCNTLTGEYSDDDGVLSWTEQPASTLMGCEPNLRDQDAWLEGLLVDGMRLESGDADLTLVADQVRWELSTR